MPTRRFSILSSRPTPCSPAIAAARRIRSSSGSSSPSIATGTPSSKRTTTSCGSSGASTCERVKHVAVLRRRDPGILERAGLDRAAPQVLVDGVRGARLHRHLDAVLRRRTRSPPRGSCAQSRTGARVTRSGASAAVATSKRTWSLPLPVQPWATASAPCSRATSTCLRDQRAREGRDQRVAPLVERAGPQHRQAELLRELALAVRPRRSPTPRPARPGGGPPRRPRPGRRRRGGR